MTDDYFPIAMLFGGLNPLPNLIIDFSPACLIIFKNHTFSNQLFTNNITTRLSLVPNLVIVRMRTAWSSAQLVP